MKRFLMSLSTGSLLGLVVGYLVFARNSGDLISPKTLLGYSAGSFQGIVNSLLGLDSIRLNIGLTILAGAVLGCLIFAGSAKSSRRY